jgi:hypothetical protein
MGFSSHSRAGHEGFNPGQPINGKREDLVLFSRDDDLLPLKLPCASNNYQMQFIYRFASKVYRCASLNLFCVLLQCLNEPSVDINLIPLKVSSTLGVDHVNLITGISLHVMKS